MKLNIFIHSTFDKFNRYQVIYIRFFHKENNKSTIKIYKNIPSLLSINMNENDEIRKK